MNAKKITIDIKGGERLDITNLDISWTDKWGTHKGVVTGFGESGDQSGTRNTAHKHVFTVTCNDGSVRQLDMADMRDIATREYEQLTARYAKVNI